MHFPLGGALARSAAPSPHESGALLHFDAGDLVDVEREVGARVCRATPRAIKLASQRQAQEQLFAHTLRQPPAEQEKFFRAFYSLDGETQSRLGEKGYLSRVTPGRGAHRPIAGGRRGVGRP